MSSRPFGVSGPVNAPPRPPATSSTKHSFPAGEPAGEYRAVLFPTNPTNALARSMTCPNLCTTCYISVARTGNESAGRPASGARGNGPRFAHAVAALPTLKPIGRSCGPGSNDFTSCCGLGASKPTPHGVGWSPPYGDTYLKIIRMPSWPVSAYVYGG